MSDGLVKNPDAALHCIPRHSHPEKSLAFGGPRCGVPESTPHSPVFASLAYEFFTKPFNFKELNS